MATRLTDQRYRKGLWIDRSRKNLNGRKVEVLMCKSISGFLVPLQAENIDVRKDIVSCERRMPNPESYWKDKVIHKRIKYKAAHQQVDLETKKSKAFSFPVTTHTAAPSSLGCSALLVDEVTG